MVAFSLEEIQRIYQSANLDLLLSYKEHFSIREVIALHCSMLKNEITRDDIYKFVKTKK